ncbi:MAG: Crp/Fnr family transcriptional regulator [Chloroflexi bacterium]|nr:Crp/Fnr family transcriptional regulator [Chloroflexota bacterium]
MPTLAIMFGSDDTKKLIQPLLHIQYNLLIGADISVTKDAELTLFLTETTEFSSLPHSPWLAWDQTGNPQAISKAYQAGARAVFPKETSMNVILDTIQRTMGELLENRKDAKPRAQRTYRRGELILLEADAVLHVEDGILATTMIHQDGVEVLLGLSGKGQIVVAHPDDNCHIQIVAHTEAKVQIEPWDVAAEQPDFLAKLRARLQQMEGWAAMQARPSLQQRVLGLLGLLSEQFGIASKQGVLIDVRITHGQLAAAVGATRTSITRVLSELRAQGRVSTVNKDGEDLFCLVEQPEHHSHY